MSTKSAYLSALCTLAMAAPAALAHDISSVVDSKNKFVIPPKYEQIKYLRYGIFQCISNKNAKGAQSELRDKNGNAIAVPVPPGTVITSAEVAGVAPGDDTFPPKEALYFHTSSDKGSGLIDVNGKVLIPAVCLNVWIKPSYAATKSADAVGVFKDHQVVVPLLTSKMHLKSESIQPNIKMMTLSNDIEGDKGSKAGNYPLLAPDLALALAHGKVPYRVIRQSGKVVFKLPDGYTNVEAVGKNRLLVHQPSGRRAAMPPLLLYDTTGHLLKSLPGHMRFMNATKNGFACELATGGFIDDAEKGIKIRFYDHEANFQNEIEIVCDTGTNFVNGLMVAAVNPKHLPYKAKESLDQGVLSDEGKWQIPPEKAKFMMAGPDRFIKTVLQAN